MSRFSFISSQHITLAQAFFESFKHSLANLLGAGWLSGTWGPDLGLCWVGQPLSEWSAHHCFWFSCSLAMRAPSGSSLLLLLGCACSCHRDVWPRVFRTMGAAPWSPGSLSASVFWEVWMQLLTLITKYSEQNKMFLLCSAGHQPLFVSASIFFSFCFLSGAVCFLYVISYRCSSWRPIEFFNLCSVLLLSVFHRDFLPTAHQRES